MWINVLAHPVAQNYPSVFQRDICLWKRTQITMSVWIKYYNFERFLHLVRRNWSFLGFVKCKLPPFVVSVFGLHQFRKQNQFLSFCRAGRRDKQNTMSESCSNTEGMGFGSFFFFSVHSLNEKSCPFFIFFHLVFCTIVTLAPSQVVFLLLFCIILPTS